MNKFTLLLFAFIFSLIGCKKKEGSLFKNPTSEQSGILFANMLTETNDLNILEYLYFYNGGGVTVGDINNDSLPDIFFSGNQVKNKLYLNRGNLKFEDITETSGTGGTSDWNTGAVMGDVNGDGLLDIYVCAVVGIQGLNGSNELYINNGTSSSGEVTFTESASKYGLDFDTYSSSAAFLDYDLDGDLDIYLLNHAVHTQESYGRANLRSDRNFQTGDKLLRNDGTTFTDISEEAGIFGGANGYGLGIAISDFNQDGWPDIYVGNDFHEDDYYYLNNGDGTFKESLKEYFGHTSRFSMGNDVADINHDGMPDILSLDMLPEDEKVLKSSQGDVEPQIMKLQTTDYGYHYQFSRNMLHLNRGNQFSEIGLQSGIAATDWSWSALFADYDQDGEQDVFISTGIPKRPNDLDYINFVSSEQIRNKITNTKLVDRQALEKMPSGKTHNYIFKGGTKLNFIDKSGDWIINDSLVSGATATADFDNDGDIDLVVNNVDSPASLYINKTDQNANYLKLHLRFSEKNFYAIGSKVYSYHNGLLQFKELYTSRGFQSSSEPIIHFGYGQHEKIDSLKIVWPDRTYQVIRNIAVNQTLRITPKNTKPIDYESLKPKSQRIFQKVDGNLGINFKHKEDNYSDFNRQKLIPYQISDRGPATAIGDLNGDRQEDIFFGGSKYIPSRIFIGTDSIFIEKKIPSIAKDSIKEDVVATIVDFNNDSKNDLFIGSGGADFFDQLQPLLDTYYINNDSVFETNLLPEYFENASVLRPNDIDGDGDIDLFVGNQIITNDFGKSPSSYVLINNDGQFSIQENQELEKIGMITDATWDDFDNDGLQDLIVVGEWMAPSFFRNQDGVLKKVSPLSEQLNGLWQKILPFDIDDDGDTDYLLGNWGTNSKFKASQDLPMRLYYGDFDENGQTETVTALEKNGKYYPLEGLDVLSSQIVSLRKKFTNYSSFAGRTIEEIFEKEVLNTSKILEVHELRSGYLKNTNGNFLFIPFKEELQTSPLFSFLKYDFDENGTEEVLIAGNYFGIKPYHGRFDSFPGALIKNENEVVLGNEIGLNFSQKSIRHMNIINLKNQPYLLVTINNDSVQVYKLNH
ncbi:CRTAC1 family protein [Zobellia laminariae]|uniref:CRTAC1 family protein n=1 Tax=Zobellia laminariae TaxID=248906 RepID=UPI0012D95F4E|nr:CRTAC1 family protein [Zobellia laminariae]